MRRLICGLLTALLMTATGPRHLAAEAKCYWIETGRHEVYLYDGSILITIHYRYFCDGQHEA